MFTYDNSPAYAGFFVSDCFMGCNLFVMVITFLSN